MEVWPKVGQHRICAGKPPQRGTLAYPQVRILRIAFEPPDQGTLSFQWRCFLRESIGETQVWEAAGNPGVRRLRCNAGCNQVCRYLRGLVTRTSISPRILDHWFTILRRQQSFFSSSTCAHAVQNTALGVLHLHKHISSSIRLWSWQSADPMPGPEWIMLLAWGRCVLSCFC